MVKWVAKFKAIPYDFTTMRLHMLFTLLFVLLAAPFTAHAEQYENMRVARIDVVAENLSPDMAFNPTSVRARMCTKVGNFFSQVEFDNDLKMLAIEYDQLDPRVEVIGNEICITLHVWFKPIIRNVCITGNQRVKTKKLLKTLELSLGDIFEREAFIQGINAIRQLYVKKGYFEAEINYEILPVASGTEVDIQIGICEGRAGKINRVCFNGLNPAEEAALLDFMLTRRYNFFLSWYSGRGLYHPEMVEHDRMQIISFFQNCGFADAVAEIYVEEIPDCESGCDKINVQINVDKGICYSIGGMSLCGNTLYSDAQIWDQFTFGIGSPYSPDNIRNTVQAINNLYGACGYIDTNVNFRLILREEAPVYDIEISICEGQQYYVGLIKVFGNCQTQTRVILHECLLCPGEIFNNCKLQGTEARLAGIGFFSAVNVYAVDSQIEDPAGLRSYKDVYIEVEETGTGNLGLFAGFSSLDRIFGGVEITERNFNLAGVAHILEKGPLALRGGGEFAHAKINIGDKQTSYTLQWTKPYFLDTPWIVGVDLEKTNNRALSSGYEIKTYGGNVHGTYIINPFLKYDVHYRARHTNVIVSDTSNPLLEKEGSQTGFISAAGMTLIYDSTDNARRAHCGFRSRLLYEIAGLGGNYQFMKFAYLNSYYYPVCARGTLKMRGELQFVKTYGDTIPTGLPLSERLFLGGETTVRGYRSFIIGPKFGNNEPRGGVSSLLLSEEYQHNLLAAPCLDAFVFVDAGYVSLSEFTLGQLSASVGFGIRVEVMANMPLMMGFGWPLHPVELDAYGQKLDTAQRFFFAIGGSF